MNANTMLTAIAPATPHDASELTASWLTNVLRASGHLADERVETFRAEMWREKRLSHLFRLQVTYAPELALPERFVLKLSRADADSSTAHRRRWKEHEFYARVAPTMADPPVPRVYGAAHDVAGNRSFLLMADLSTSHSRPPSPLPPTPDQLRGDIDCLAAIHAWWWAHPDLGGVIAERDDGWIRDKAAVASRNLSRFMDDYEPHLPAVASEALKAACAGWPTILRRSAWSPLTVVHGDAHPWNFLTPLHAADTVTRLLDWEGWSIEPGPHDLASLLALHLPPTVRNELEGELIERYLQQLRGHGVDGYDFESCWADYRLAIARRMLSPVGMWSRGSQAHSWWPILERVSMAFHEHQCAEVL